MGINSPFLLIHSEQDVNIMEFLLPLTMKNRLESPSHKSHLCDSIKDVQFLAVTETSKEPHQ